MVNKRALKALGEIMEYLDGEEVEGMKSSNLPMDEDGEGGAVAVLEVKKDENRGGEEASECPDCGSSTLGANYCPGCGKKMKGGAAEGGREGY